MDNLPAYVRWSREPIVVLPISAAVLGLMLLPFFLFGMPDAASFYGAYFAGITSVGGVIAVAQYNVIAAIRRDDRQQRKQLVALVRIASAEIGPTTVWCTFAIMEADEVRQELSRRGGDAIGSEVITRSLELLDLMLRDRPILQMVRDYKLQLCGVSSQAATTLLHISSLMESFPESPGPVKGKLDSFSDFCIRLSNAVTQLQQEFQLFLSNDESAGFR